MNILIIRTSAIGDVVMASGLIPAIKSKYPDAHITWVVEPAASQLLMENNDINRVLNWPKGVWKQYWKNKEFSKLLSAVRRFRAELRKNHYDLVIDAQGLLKSSFLAWLSGGKRRVGIGKKEGSWLFHTETVDKVSDDPLISSEYRALSNALDFDSDKFAMDLPYSEQTRESAHRALYEHVTAGEHYAVICPFTTRPQKHWFDDHWLALVTMLQEKRSLRAVMLGGPGDIDHAAKLEESASGLIINLAGKTKLLEAVAIIDQAQCLVGVDTGLTHMGIAKNTPTIALFGSTRPYLDTQSDTAVVVYDDMSCSPCRRNPTCDGQFTCMKNLNPERIIDALQGILE